MRSWTPRSASRAGRLATLVVFLAAGACGGSSTLSSDKAITQFTISGVQGIIGGSHIAVPLAGGTVTALAPTIAVSTGATVSPASGVAQDFTNPVTYTVTAADQSTKTYSVFVSTTANQKNMLLFSILGVDACASGCTGTLTTGGGAGSGSIALQLPSGTNLTSLVPTFAITSGATADLQSGVAQNFSMPVTYNLLNPASTNGTTPKAWVVTVTAP